MTEIQFVHEIQLGNNFTRHHLIIHMNVVLAGNMLSNVRSFIIFGCLFLELGKEEYANKVRVKSRPLILYSARKSNSVELYN